MSATRSTPATGMWAKMRNTKKTARVKIIFERISGDWKLLRTVVIKAFMYLLYSYRVKWSNGSMVNAF